MALNTAKDIEEEDTRGLLTPPEGGHQPFDGEAKSLDIGKPVSEHQLIQEVYERLGDRAAFEVVIAGDEGQQKLYVLGDADMRTVRDALESHRPDPNYGLDEGAKELRQLRERLLGGEDLPSSDLNKLMRALL